MSVRSPKYEHCTCPCTCGKGKNAPNTPNSMLYQGPFRKPLLMSLILIAISNVAQLVLAAIAVPVTVTIAYENWYIESTHGPAQTGIWFFWLTIPLIVTTNSTIELFKRTRRTLRLRRMLISGLISLALWLIATGYWTPCIFNGPYDNHPTGGYCPFPGPDAWYWYRGMIWVNDEPSLIPLFMIATMVFHFVHITLSAVTLRTERRATRIKLEEKVADVEGSPFKARYKITSSLYTDADFVSDQEASTLRSNHGSSNRDTQPPSYRGPDSTKSSQRDSSSCSESSLILPEVERAHVRG